MCLLRFLCSIGSLKTCKYLRFMPVYICLCHCIDVVLFYLITLRLMVIFKDHFIDLGKIILWI